jgi:hypothetical protein
VEYYIHRCKNWFSRSGGFCYDSASTFRQWQIGKHPLAYRDMPMVVQLLRELPTLANFFLRKVPKVCGPFFAALAVRATVVRPLAYHGRHSAKCKWTKGRVIAKSAGSGEPVFYIDGSSTVTTVALRQAIFKRKKGFAAISLGLIYHSMVLPQLPSRDTVTLNDHSNRCIIV